MPKKKGYDAGKKISGIKIHIVTDIMGLPHAISVTTANISDRDAAVDMIETYAPNLSSLAKVLADGGYTGENFAQAVASLIGAEVEVAKRSELHKFAVIPKRWIVERTFGWLENYRRLWKNCERKLENTVQMTVLAFVSLLLRRW
jgi:transposase